MRCIGEVAEWFKAHAWKVCLLKGNGGSNPSFSANAARAAGGPKLGSGAWSKLRTRSKLGTKGRKAAAALKPPPPYGGKVPCAIPFRNTATKLAWISGLRSSCRIRTAGRRSKPPPPGKRASRNPSLDIFNGARSKHRSSGVTAAYIASCATSALHCAPTMRGPSSGPKSACACCFHHTAR